MICSSDTNYKLYIQNDFDMWGKMVFSKFSVINMFIL